MIRKPLARLAVLALGVASLAVASPTQPSANDYCAPVIASQTDDWNADGNQGEMDALRAQGWQGKAGDGMEALYAPGC